MATQPAESIHSVNISPAPGELSGVEKRWVSWQPYLLSQGYQLRPRYRPGWVPSWISSGANPYDCEDSINSLPVRTLDAMRIEDDTQVVIKILLPSNEDREGAEELEILQHLSSNSCQSDPTNHCVPCLDSFPIPDVSNGTFYVMPLLRQYDDPPFYNLREIHGFLTQAFQGLQFLHKNNIAHCDIASPNMMMGGRILYNEPFHPFSQYLTLDGKRSIRPRYTRSQRNTQYYYIDFGYAKWFRNPDEPHTVTGSRAREPTPEQLAGEPYDPFKADIYQLGAILRRDLIPKYPTLRFLLPLAREMTDRDPDKRPTLERAHQAMNTQFAGIPGWKTRWPIAPSNAAFRQRSMYFLAGVVTEVMQALRRVLRSVFFLSS
ncbi:Pkinase domain-containing protein [Ceratobasidium theobromae]|uniref:Pkinase domain-containing protein n=1 Tax=Ceratobasidium theobromae TaxID=1582974 RepID=A0A5N5QAQ3_9AGAM|nr:Pkinase domain-containing protein [Ceratobasidium theobromae]